MGPSTPMGKLMRNYWLPACLSEELPEPGCDPIEVTLLGEELVAFRNEDGEVGLMDRYCPHRRANLAWARPEGCGLRCIYHGWYIGADGQVIETPPESPNSQRARTAKTTSYPTREHAGIVWAYLGATKGNEVPDMPPFPFMDLPDDRIVSFKLVQPNNWVRVLDAEMDAGHAGYLHYSEDLHKSELEKHYDGHKFLFDPVPSVWVKRYPWGLENVMRFGLEDPDRSTFWVRHFIAPCFGISGQKDGARGRVVAKIPNDNNSTTVYYIYFRADAAMSREEVIAHDKYLLATSGDPNNDYYSTEWIDGVGYVQNRQSMRDGKSYSGIRGVAIQDHAVTWSMGEEVDLSKEHLGTEDEIVIKVRRTLLDLLDIIDAGEKLPSVDWSKVQYRWVVKPTDTPLADISAHPEWATTPEPVPADWQPAQAAWQPIFTNSSSK
ncbi:Rieske 2Fe-2S domain-containing protein [Arthrobacter sulfonylureivorans]|uniref:Rieske 2Fe-2S domain-containing protein n=1 Tax=Arthrobacter sulfonylureivorans TaxID=2486855 RepID=A0ABY3WJS8_9MICC|nr:Rieske 2Fe-2S domain-containing protein [Arthrobacter sulfonylureivorans]UNK47884.1 Rieske 2Fe-2S domain-containing protein [Arthrobacter sulfonylureivorans]